MATRVVPQPEVRDDEMTVAGLPLLVLRSRLNHEVARVKAHAIMAEMRYLVDLMVPTFDRGQQLRLPQTSASQTVSRS